MKNEAVVKINKMGKAGWILAKIWFACMCIGVVGCLIGAVALFVMPNDFLKVQVSGAAQMELNFPESWDMGDLTNSEDFLDNHKIAVGDSDSMIQMTELDVDGRMVHMKGEADLYTYGFKEIRIVLFIAAFIMLLAGITGFFAVRLGKAVMDCNSPFEEEIIKNIQYVAYSLIPWCFVGSINSMISLSYHGMASYFSLDISKVLFCLIILAIAYIFKYGAKLQQESDETL